MQQCIIQNKIHDYNSLKRDIIACCRKADVEYIICCRHLLFFACPVSVFCGFFSFPSFGNNTLISFWEYTPPHSSPHLLSALIQAPGRTLIQVVPVRIHSGLYLSVKKTKLSLCVSVSVSLFSLFCT